jgi:hypothetical protein
VDEEKYENTASKPLPPARSCSAAQGASANKKDEENRISNATAKDGKTAKEKK